MTQQLLDAFCMKVILLQIGNDFIEENWIVFVVAVARMVFADKLFSLLI